MKAHLTIEERQCHGQCEIDVTIYRQGKPDRTYTMTDASQKRLAALFCDQFFIDFNGDGLQIWQTWRDEE